MARALCFAVPKGQIEVLYFADVSTVFFFGMFSVVLRGCSMLTSFLLSLQVLFYFLGGVHMLLLLKGWMADL